MTNDLPPSPKADSSLIARLRNRAFKVDIVFLFCAIIIPTVLTVTTFSYHQNSKAALEMTHDLVKKITDSVMDATINYLRPAQIYSEITANVMAHAPEDLSTAPHLDRYLMGVVRSRPHISLAYYGTDQGDFLAAVRLRPEDPVMTRLINRHADPAVIIERIYDDRFTAIKETHSTEVVYDPRQRPWYKGCKQTGETYWTDLYVFSSTGKLGVTAAAPVKGREGTLRGVVGTDITLEGLSTFLKRTTISKGGTIFIMTRKGQLVAFPDPDRMVRLEGGKIVSVQAYELNDRRINDAVHHLENTGESMFTIEVEHQRIMAFFTPFPKDFGKDWLIAVIAPEDDFVGPVKATHTKTLIMSGFILLLAVGCGFLFARNLSRPIEALTSELRGIKGFDLARRPPVVSAIFEIQMMAEAVESMKNGLRAFGRYVPTTLVRQLIESGEEVTPGGREREITLFFSDVADFTSISEQIPARELMVNLSEYMDVMTCAINEEKGTVDKYIGDAVMAFWGAPVPDDLHALHACRAALRCRCALDELNVRWRTEGKIPFITRIGIHTGFTIVGNMGSTERLNYTVLGDNVNLASRLEGVNKVYGTSVIISQATHRYVRNDFIIRPLDIIAVKGKLTSVVIYELMGDRESADAQRLDTLAREFSRAFDLYLHRQWDQAVEILEHLKSDFPHDGPVTLLLERSLHCLQNDPGPEWSGSVRLDSK